MVLLFRMALRSIHRLHPVISTSLLVRTWPSLWTNIGYMAPLPSACRQCGVQQTVLTRALATKKSKAKGKGQTQSKVNINASLVEDIIDLEEVKKEMQAVTESLKEDFSKNLRIRSSPGALDHITVTTKDGKFPLNQLGQISMKSPQLLIVNMLDFPESTAAALKALRESRMNLNPEVDGTVIHVPLPKVTREHRENLAKLAKQLTNKGKDSLRRVRGDAIVEVKKAKSTISEDLIKLIEKQIQQMADDTVAEMDKQLATKTKELLGSE